MKFCDIGKIELTPSGELFVYPAFADKSLFEYVYRAAKGVYWDGGKTYFYMKQFGDWSPAEVFQNILLAVKDELGVELLVRPNTQWQGLEQKTVGGSI